ncbi:unnamed protein product, partial [Notodromas monacha]
ETRHIIAAIIQHVTYNEFLPMVLGEDMMKIYGLLLEKEGYFESYDPTVDPSSSSAFITAAFRFGHSMVPSTIERWSPKHRFIGAQRLSELLRQPFDLFKGGWSDQYMSGLVNQVSQGMDEAMSQEVTNHLFQDPMAEFGLDLAALNIQRGRDHGLPSYNDFRQVCGMPRVASFPHLRRLMPNATAQRFGDIYASVDDFDLWSGGLGENPLPGSMVGPVFACLIALQFRDLRFGDRFWYENGNQLSSFTPGKFIPSSCQEEMREFSDFSLHFLPVM